LDSLKAAIERLGYKVEILEQPNQKIFDAIVIPGQGRFGTVMKNIQANNWSNYLKTMWQKNIPMLGICVGMQIFFEASDEDPEVNGLAWLKGKAEMLSFPKKPMVGWAKLSSQGAGNQSLISNETTVYFVNSYAVKNSNYSIAQTTYGENFCASFQYGSLTGVQFHPEKSSQAGSQIIQQALEGIKVSDISGGKNE